MGFDAFSKSAGFDLYSGKNEYPNPSDFDGHWGIWDEPYLQYIAGELNHLRQPFLGTVFTLSSHHPYKLPAGYSNKFKKGPLDIQQTIMYTDYALKQFFKTAATMPWYKNTLFVITADHTSEAWLPFYKTRVGQYRIPIWFFDPASPDSLLSDQIAQQTDIMPTILDKLHYSRNFNAFGNSLLRPSETKFSLSYLNGNYQLIFNSLALQTDMQQSGYLFNVSDDSLLTRNILSRNNADFVKMDALLKAIVQQYNNRMNHNKLSSD
jgi:phosphoglycerol transferase MdoB-like AlkP superfamily enzyme